MWEEQVRIGWQDLFEGALHLQGLRIWTRALQALRPHPSIDGLSHNCQRWSDDSRMAQEGGCMEVNANDSFEKVFAFLCQMLGGKPSEQLSVLGKYDNIRRLPDRHLVWFRSSLATYWWQNGLVTSLSVPTSDAGGHSCGEGARDYYVYRGVRLGMTKAQVKHAWGDPSSEGSQVWEYEHKLPYITRGPLTLKADLSLGFDESDCVSCFIATLDGPNDSEFRRLMQRSHYCLGTHALDEAAQCATKAEELLDGGGGGSDIEGTLFTPALVRERVQAIRAASHEKSASENGKPAGCFAATAAYGPSDTNVLVLREYRDRILEPCWHGRLFVRLYAVASPPLAVFIGRSRRRRRIARRLLRPCVSFAVWRMKRSDQPNA
jgi:hypothetical protein